MPEGAIDAVARLEAAIRRAREALAAERERTRELTARLAAVEEHAAKEALAAERERTRELTARLEEVEKLAARERAEIGQRVEALAEGLEELLADGDS